MSIAFLTRDFAPKPPVPGGCAYYRCHLPMLAVGAEARFGLPAWTAQQGFGVVTGVKRAQFGFDTVVLKLLMNRGLVYQMRVAQGLGQRIIVDVDDFYPGLEESNLAFYTTHPDNNKINNREHYREVILAADTVTVTTPFLLDYYSQLHPNVVMIRNGVFPQQFDTRKVRDRRPVIGWVGAVPWRSNDLETLSDWLPGFLDEHDLMFHHSGAEVGKSLADIVGIRPERVTTSPMVPLSFYHELMSFDIGLVPLSGVPFNEAKSTIKGLEYAAAGIPFVAQSLPEYQRLAGMGVGRVALTVEDWVRETSALLDYHVRKKDARVNYSLMVRDHSMVARAGEWRELFA